MNNIDVEAHYPGCKCKLDINCELLDCCSRNMYLKSGSATPTHQHGLVVLRSLILFAVDLKGTYYTKLTFTWCFKYVSAVYVLNQPIMVKIHPLIFLILISSASG